MNRGIRISSIYKALEEDPGGGRLLGAAGWARAILEILTDPRTRRQGRPFARVPDGAPAVVGRAVALLGDGTAVEERRRGGPSGTVIRRKPDDHFADRKGYDPAFLADVSGATRTRRRNPLHVPLPGLPAWLEADAARLKSDPQAYVLPYQHFSIAVSASRRLAIYTACNVHGGLMLDLGREDRDPDRPLAPGVMPEAAADVWFYDPRLDERDQLGPELLDRTSFDYGHLVRRLDPVWGQAGDLHTPRIANDDTFCMTNCSPQEARFHRTRRDGDGNWSALEDVIRDEANLKDKRFVVMTGPVLHPADPVILGLRVPRAFWKVVAYEEGGALKAHGFMLWQEQEVAEVDARFERARAAVDLSRARRALPIREVARATGLDFGPLFGADVRG